MKKFLSVVLWSICFFVDLAAQDSCNILVKLDNYANDTLWMGPYFGKRTTTLFFALRQQDGFFNLKKDMDLPEGMYAIIYKRNKNASKENFPCWLLDGQRQFTLESDLNNLQSARITGSLENEGLFQYFYLYELLNDSLNDATTAWKSILDENSFEAMRQCERNLQSFQDRFIQNHPGSRTAELVTATRFLTSPDADGTPGTWEQKAAARLEWQRQHFFDRMNLVGDDFLKYPLWVDRTDYFAFKLAMPNPESSIGQLEALLRMLEPNRVAYRYYFRYIMQSLARISRFRTDEVYSYFVRKYVDTGKADWMDAADLERYRDDADRLEPLFVGKKSPDVTFYDKAGQPVSIYQTDASYLLLVFWMHDCSHCRREIPILIKLNENLQSKGLKVMSVCGKIGDDEMSKCWDFAENIKMPADWLLLADPKRRSRFQTLLDVRSYPRLILLDKNKTILYKQSGELPEKALFRELERAMDSGLSNFKKE
ncbi:MAG TPA: TlpA disulfide reductase family protein [Saprospiraceae bacterium]|nr:TlpA disulfide reductase family protein [Saprospiraceae bacterium]